MGTCGMVGPIGVYSGWVADVAAGAKAAITGFDWLGLVLICFVLPAILSPLFNQIMRKLARSKMATSPSINKSQTLVKNDGRFSLSKADRSEYNRKR